MFNAKFYEANRQRLMQRHNDALIVIPSHSMLQKSADTAYPFRQDSSFYYLTGVNEPDIVLVLDTKKQKTLLLLPSKNDYQNEWDGGLNQTELADISGVTEVTAIDVLPNILKQAKSAQKTVYIPEPLPDIVEPYGFWANPARRELRTIVEECGVEWSDVRTSIASLRQIKQPQEIAAIKKAIDITASGLAEVRKNINNFQNEKDVERALTAHFYANGADGHAYDPIIASGKNASIIHYQKNNQPVKQDELLLFDVGALVDGYASDISRTWAVGRASERKQQLHATILDLQQQAFELLGPGADIRSYQKEMEKRTKKALKKLDVNMGQFPHGFSHFLGLDVHDAGDYHAPLAIDSVLTVEPGVYLPEEGIGIRVEDNILITENGIENLSKDIPHLL